MNYPTRYQESTHMASPQGLKKIQRGSLIVIT